MSGILALAGIFALVSPVWAQDAASPDISLKAGLFFDGKQVPQPDMVICVRGNGQVYRSMP